jgi:hypothetical protein
MMSLEATYIGDTCTASAKLEGSNVVELTFMQTIVENIAVGVQFLHIPQPMGAITGSSVAARVWSKEGHVKPLTQQRVPRWVAALNSGTVSPLHATFTWHTPTKADFATEFALQPRQDGSLESVWCAGGILPLYSSFQ